MFNDHKSTNRILALFVFVASLTLYVITMAPTASFWDAGEFIAVAHGLQVNHPPGAPFYSLLGRMFSMFMPTSYVAVSINFISALASALTVMLLYLIIIRLVREWQNDPDAMSPIDKIGMFGGAMLGAFTFAVTDTFWFNAVEAEVYALSMFFTAAVVWMALKWSEHHEEQYSERWLILIAYMFGLALGVHLLNLLALFFVALIVFFKKREVTLISLAATGVVAVVSFLVIYPFTVQMLPSILDNVTRASYGLIGPIFFMIVILGSLSYGIYFTHTRGYRIANLVLISYAMILIGYSSYSVIFIRSIADPPIDENDPETVDAFISYLEREQYGDTPLLTGYTYDNAQGRINQQEEVFFPRRYSPQHLQQYSQYSSDLDFFIDYQLNHMYVRYFNWNFIGRESDIQDTGWQAGFSESPYEDNPAHNSYFYIPFLLGLFGMIFHFQKDWKRALSVLVLFIMTGLAIIVFLNQTPMQPRERDYAYVGSFFAFSIWIGMGGIGIIELVKDYLTSNKLLSYGMLGLLFFAAPIWMGYQNFDDHDRSERYVAPDYAWNLLQSVAPNSILFTNGDNDTFPLWYLQEVEGVRTDVRIVCLSLLNTDWYIKQLRSQWSHESAPLPISLTDEEIDQITQSLTLHEPDTVEIPVNKELLKSAFSDDNTYKETIGVKPDTALSLFREGVDFGIPVDSLDNTVSWYYEGRSAGRDQQGNRRFYTQVQDKVILDILETNRWLRPVYFANTVSPSSQMNLHDYFRFEGKAFRVVPKKHEGAGSYGWLDPEIHSKRLRTFRFREWNNPDAYFDENIRRMLGNYRYSITQLADSYRKLGQPDSAAKWLRWGEEKIPFHYVGDNINSLVLYAYAYARNGALEDATELAEKGKEEIIEDLTYDMDRYDRLQSRIMQLDTEAKNAKRKADLTAQGKLRSEIQNVISQRENLANEIGYNISHLTILQRVYFMAGMDEEAIAMAERVNGITMDRISIPTSREENRKQIERYNL
ncbi:MAG: DUF2723 domain-containing protein [Balneolaceae bacterium]|nr:DUF2723 domain-containing protein [Balneolaceae bacterium]